jgi:hypothetical protein
VLYSQCEKELFQNVKNRHENQLKIEKTQNLGFHFEKLFLGVSVFTEITKLSAFWRINILKFRGNPKTGNSEQLKVFSFNLPKFQKSVNNILRQKKSSGLQFEFLMNFKNPIAQNPLHSGIDFLLNFYGVLLRNIILVVLS